MAADDGNDEMTAYLKVYCGLTPREQNSVTPEQICERAQISINDLFASVMWWCSETTNVSFQLLKAASRPRALQRLAREATKAGPQHGHDRDSFFKITGDMPMPSKYVQNNFGQPGGTNSLVGRSGPAPKLLGAGQRVLEMEQADNDDILDVEST
jgi:hypothetical protein